MRERESGGGGDRQTETKRANERERVGGGGRQTDRDKESE